MSYNLLNLASEEDIGSLIYHGESGEESLDGIQTGDGYIDCSGDVGDAEMQYFLRDHLGSVRVVASDRNTVLRRSDYLPFGVRMEMDDLQQGVGRSGFFGFSGKENEMWPSPYGSTDVVSSPVQSIPHWELGERYQHFGARAYDPLTCTFLQTDPLAEKYYGISPYAYCAGNPVMFVDPDGRVEVLARAAIGAAIGAAVEGTVTYLHGGSGREVLGSMARGALEGAGIAVLGPEASVWENAGVGALSSAAGSFAEQSINAGNLTDVNMLQVFGEGAVGSIFSVSGDKMMKVLSKRIDNKCASTVFKEEVEESVKESFESRGIKESASKVKSVATNQIKNIKSNEMQTLYDTKKVTDYTIGLSLSGFLSSGINGLFSK